MFYTSRPRPFDYMISGDESEDYSPVSTSDNVAIGPRTMPVGEPSSADSEDSPDTETRGEGDENEDPMGSDEEQPRVHTGGRKCRAKV